MEEIWSHITDFPKYAVSNHGSVMNVLTHTLMKHLRNQRGYTYVGLFNAKGVQLNRSVALLVANAFLKPHPLSSFNTPINVNGIRTDNYVSNLMWRPRWFAYKYHRQFYTGPRGFLQPVYDVDTGEQYPTSFQAAIRYGLLDREILLSAIRNEPVWPTEKRFHPVT